MPDVVEATAQNLKFTWDDVSPAEKVILAALATLNNDLGGVTSRIDLVRMLRKNELCPPEGELTAALQTLRMRDIFSENFTDHYTFTIEPLRLWLSKERRLDFVRQELARSGVIESWQQTTRTSSVKLQRWIIPFISLLLILLIFAVGFIIYQQRQSIPTLEEQAQVYTSNFRRAPNSNMRLTNLAELFNLPGYEDQARRLFYEELTPEERLTLFNSANAQISGAQLVTVVRGLYTDLDNTERDNALLEVMSQSLTKANDMKAVNLATEIKQWQRGRVYQAQGDYEEAITVYGIFISINDRNPGVYYDRGLAYTALRQADKALADFEMVLKLDPGWQKRIEALITSNPLLYKAAIAGGSTYPAVVALAPSPTSTPTSIPTTTSVPTPMPRSTFTPTSTATPLSKTEVVSSEATIILLEAPKNTSTSTPVPTPTPTPTPQPATIVYVQSNGQNHRLGIVSSAGVLINGDLHRSAAAPAWSLDGRQIAFYGEENINALGGIYAQGSGIWLIEPQSGSVRQLFPIDHVTNLNWSPDGTRLAFEVGPPGVTHQIYVIDARDGKQVSLFAGEQPAWSPDGQNLVIKSCLPECGLWQVTLNGSSIALLSNNSTDSYPTWSSDGRYIAFASRARAGDWEIYRLTLGEETPLRLTDRLGSDTTPVFSPDGLEIYFRTDTSGSWEVRAMTVDGTHERSVKLDVGPSEDWGLARPAVY